MDESGDHTSNDAIDIRKRFLGLSGIVFPLDSHREFAPKLESFKEGHIPTYDADDCPILHREDIVGKTHHFKHLADHHEARRFYSALADLIEGQSITAFSVVVDKHSHARADYRRIRHPYCYAFQVLMEKYARYLGYVGAVGDIIAASRGGREDLILKEEYKRVYGYGTRFLAAGEFKRLLTSKELKIKNKQANVAGLQVADLFAHPMTRDTIILYGKSAPRELPYFDERIRQFARKRFYQSASGRSHGWGQVILA